MPCNVSNVRFCKGPGINKVLAQYQSTINTVKAWCAFLKVSAEHNTGCLVMFLMFLFPRGIASPRWHRCVCHAERIKLVPCNQQSISTVCLAESIKLVPCDQQSISAVCLAESISMVGPVGRHHLPPGVNARVRARAGLEGGQHPKTTGNRFHTQIIHRHTH